MIGGTGFLGSHLIARLWERSNDRIIIGLRDGDSIKNILAYPVELDYGYERIEEADMIYFCAGALGKKGTPLEEYRYVHAEFPSHILDRMTNNQSFMYVSSAYVFNADEPYEKTKITGEQVVRYSGIPYWIIRPSPIYGERDYHHLPLFKIISKLGLFTPIIGDGNNRVCLSYVDDVVDFMLEPPAREFVVANEPITIRQLMYLINYVLDRGGKPFIHIPYKQDAFKWVNGVKFLTQDRTYSGYVGKTDYTTGLQRTALWYKQNGLV